MSVQEVSFYLVMMINVGMGITLLNDSAFQRAFGVKPNVWLSAFLKIFVAMTIYIISGALSLRLMGIRFTVFVMAIIGAIIVLNLIVMDDE